MLMQLVLCESMADMEENRMNKLRCYSELIKLKTFEERFEYLKLDGKVGEETFGFDRFLTFPKTLKNIERSMERRNYTLKIQCEVKYNLITCY